MLFLPALLSKKCWWSSVEVESSVKYCRYYCCCCCCHCGRWLVAFYCCRECCCCNLFFFTFNAGIELDNDQHTVDVCCAMKRPIYKIEPSTSTARSKSMENNYVRPSVRFKVFKHWVFDHTLEMVMYSSLFVHSLQNVEHLNAVPNFTFVRILSTAEIVGRKKTNPFKNTFLWFATLGV